MNEIPVLNEKFFLLKFCHKTKALGYCCTPVNNQQSTSRNFPQKL